MQSSYVPKKKTNRVFVNRTENFHKIGKELNKSILFFVVVASIKNMDKIIILKTTWVHSFQCQFKNVNS